MRSFLYLFAICSALLPLRAEAPQGNGLALYSYAPIVEKASPAVVNIYTEKVVEQVQGIFPGFFGEFLGGHKVKGVQNSLGSGVIVRADGIIITNAHVVKGASKIRIILNTEEELEAEIVVIDKRVDLAALRLKNTTRKDFPHLDVAPYDELRVGDMVLAIGCPRGLKHTVTGGMISGLGRTEIKPHDFRHLVQVDSDLAGGSSGGAIIISTHQGPMLAAIATAILVDHQGAPTGFGIPGIFIGPLLRAVDHGGKLQPCFDGLSTQNISPDMRKALSLQNKDGVLVRAVYPHSPAAQAGIQRGDVLLSMNGHPLKNQASHQFRLSIAEPEKTISYEVLCHGEHKKHVLKLTAIPDAKTAPLLLAVGEFLSGVTVQELNPYLNYECDREITDQGIMIVDVPLDSKAYMMGFRPHDVIRKINKQNIATLHDLQHALRSSIATLDLQRNGVHL